MGEKWDGVSTANGHGQAWQLADRTKAIQPGVGPWLTEVAPFTKKKISVCVPQSRDFGSYSLLHLSHKAGSRLGKARMIPVGCWAIAHLASSAPNFLGLSTGGSEAVLLLRSLFQSAQALGTFQLEAAGQRLLA
jgi:hypothetical protein